VGADSLHVFALAGGLGCDAAFARRGVDAFGVEVAQRLCTFVLYHVQRLGEIARPDGRTAAQCGFE
jgi:hypothetical protein